MLYSRPTSSDVGLPHAHGIHLTPIDHAIETIFGRGFRRSDDAKADTPVTTTSPSCP
jgi:hypothetical protein